MVQQGTSKRSLNGAYFLPISDITVMPTFPFSHRLESILSKRNLAPAKLDELKIKVNILKSFVAEEPAEEPAEEASKESISREEAEL